jgi:poly(3-hydroxybutyrate) depolymerase
MNHSERLLALWTLAALVACAAQPSSIGNPAAVSVSGFSSGGFAANQFHVAFSASLVGAGIIAGGPYEVA